MKQLFISFLLLLISCSVFAQGNLNRTRSMNIMAEGDSVLADTNAVTIKWQGRLENMAYPNDWETVGTIPKADVIAAETNYFVLADLTGWTFYDYVQFRAVGTADSCLSAEQKVSFTEGMLTLGVKVDTTYGAAGVVSSAVSMRLGGR